MTPITAHPYHHPLRDDDENHHHIRDDDRAGDDDSDSAQWGFVSADHGDVNVHVIKEASFLATTATAMTTTDSMATSTAAEDDEDHSSLLHGGELIVEGPGDVDDDDAGFDVDNLPSDISIDLSIPDTESLPTDTPTLSTYRSALARVYNAIDSNDHGSDDAEDMDDDRNSAAATSNNNDQDEDDFFKTQQLWIFLVGILSMLSVGLVAANSYQNHLRTIEQQKFQEQIMNLREEIETLRLEEERKKTTMWQYFGTSALITSVPTKLTELSNSAKSVGSGAYSYVVEQGSSYMMEWPSSFSSITTSSLSFWKRTEDQDMN